MTQSAQTTIPPYQPYILTPNTNIQLILGINTTRHLCTHLDIHLYIACEASKGNFVEVISDFFFETVQKNKFIYFYRRNFQISRDLIEGSFRTMKHCAHRRYPTISIFSEILLLRCLCKNISYNFTRLAMFYLEHLYSKTLYVSMMERG